MRIKSLFSFGDAVQADGCYVCVPCGFRRFLCHGETFPECFSCRSEGFWRRERVSEGFEIWERTAPSLCGEDIACEIC